MMHTAFSKVIDFINAMGNTNLKTSQRNPDCDHSRPSEQIGVGLDRMDLNHKGPAYPISQECCCDRLMVTQEKRPQGCLGELEAAADDQDGLEGH